MGENAFTLNGRMIALSNNPTTCWFVSSDMETNDVAELMEAAYAAGREEERKRTRELLQELADYTEPDGRMADAAVNAVLKRIMGNTRPAQETTNGD